MRRNLMVIVTVGVLFGLVFAGTAGATPLDSDHVPAVGDEESDLFQTNTTTDGVNTTTDANETVETGETNETVEGDEGNETIEANETPAVGPGTYLSGAVGAHRAELEEAVEERAFGLSVAAAVSNGSKAGLVTNQTERLETRLQELERYRDELEASYQNGSIQNSTYQAQLTTLEARITATERMINRTITESERLPHEVRRAHGVNETRLNYLRNEARNLTGPEVAALARTIGGPMTGRPAGERGPPAHAGPGGSMGPPEGVPGDDNTTRGPPANTTRGPPRNSTAGQNTNDSHGPPDNRTRGPGNDNTNGPPENGSMGPPEDRGRNNSANRAGR